MALTKPPVLPVWADTGDKAQPTDAEIQAGWPVSNIPPSRQRFNWFFNFCANAVRYLTRRGIPDWAADETYMTGDRVQCPTGTTYVSLVDNNAGFIPEENPAKWDTWGMTGTFVGTTYAPINSPAFAGDPRAPTPPLDDNDTSIATTEFVHAAVQTAATSNSKLYFVSQI